MRIEKQIVSWTHSLLHARPAKQLFNQIEQITNLLPKIWRKLEDHSYSWNLSGLNQIQNLLKISAKHSRHIQRQLTKLSKEAGSQLIPIFKNKAFLKVLSKKMNLSCRTVNSIPSLLNKFTQAETPFSPTSLLILVLFIALGAQVPLIIKGSFNAKKAFFTVATVLDYVATAIQIAKHFQKNRENGHD